MSSSAVDTTLSIDAAGSDTAGSLLRLAQRECDPLLRSVVMSMPEPLATMAGYHFGWWDTDRFPTGGTTGKYLRPALVLGAAAVCGDCFSAAASAAAVELTHNFSLLHDDIMDADLTRRGRATVWSVWGTGNAILLGDALHAEAIRLLASLPNEGLTVSAVARLESACVEMCRGQYEDGAFECCSTVAVADYQRMAAAKTAGLMGCACALGALAAGADTQTTAAMECFGFELGLAFQYVDDLIGIWGDPRVTGKPVGNDLSRRKATLPVVLALNTHCQAAAELAELYQSEDALTPADVAVATELVDAAGGKLTTQQLAEERVQAAITSLPDSPRCHELIALAQLVTGRRR